MAIFLVQHGRCLSGKEDPEKGLSPLGEEEIARLAPVAKGYGIPVTQIFHSGKKRAQQTAARYQSALGLDAAPAVMAGIAPLDDVRAFADTLDPACGWMVVGHLPFMERLVAYLTTGNEELRVYRFQNAGIVCLDGETDAQGNLDWFIKWTLNPNIT
ncbi:MAG TPA: phosphohistidine phosphatase SixA [Desulfobacteraceae bacterium]|nr:phosphohistidine phosphatase SixA [Desulfobacteraceae bacterium]